MMARTLSHRRVSPPDPCRGEMIPFSDYDNGNDNCKQFTFVWLNFRSSPGPKE